MPISNITIQYINHFKINAHDSFHCLLPVRYTLCPSGCNIQYTDSLSRYWSYVPNRSSNRLFLFSSDEADFDVDFVFDRLRYYAFLSLIPTLLIAIITSWSIYYKDNFLSRLSQSFIIIFPLNILFLILKERLDFTFRNHLFRTKTNLYVNIEQFTAQLSSIMKTEELEKNSLMKSFRC